MPRSKNPKPQKQLIRLRLSKKIVNNEKEVHCVSLVDSDGEDVEKTLDDRSLSSPEMDPAKSEEDRTEDSMLSKDVEDYQTEEKGSDDKDAEPQLSERKETEDASALSRLGHGDKDTTKSNKAAFPKEDGGDATVDKSPIHSTSLSNANVLSWLQKRFVLRDDAKTSAAQVIKLYAKEAGPGFAPLQSYQVGQLLRRIFPKLERRKITVDGKRIWVYKHLSVRTDKEESTMTTEEESRNHSALDNEENQDQSLFDDYSVTGKNACFSSSPGSAREKQRPVKNSAILYNLLHPHSNNMRSPSTFRKVPAKTSVQVKHSLPKSYRDESIIPWLRENYEYADGYFVKSANVLKKYNQSGQAEVRYLSQVGRIIKHVFPNARHLRRSLKGGKREWVYHNIRPKDHTENDLWKGSRKNALASVSPPRYHTRPSMVPISRFSGNKPIKLEVSEDGSLFSRAKSDLRSFAGSLSVAGRDKATGEVSTDGGTGDPFRSEEGFFGKSSSASPSPRLVDHSSSVFYKSEAINSDRIQEELDCNGFYRRPANDELDDESGRDDCHLPAANSNSESVISVDIDQAEDLSISSKEQTPLAVKRCLAEECDSEPDSVGVPLRKKFKNRESASGRDAARQQSMEHNYSYAQIVDTDLRVKDFVKPKGNFINSSRSARPDNSESSSSRANGSPGHSVSSSKELQEPLQWEDLSLCEAHQFGWTLTPTLNNEIPPNYIEWVLFEGQLLRDGQRVFRELKIYDNWSVSIHAMGKKVQPEELGGITDLSRTKRSVSKVFSTLAAARSCRGFSALSLSDLCVHGVVVAKTEIWSSRENTCEELRHRAINCQVLYCGPEEMCPKCHRVIRMHSRTYSGSTGNNGISSRESRFHSRSSSHM